MSGRILNWLVVKWQWPYAALFAAGFLAILAPLVFRYAGIPLGLVYLQLPIYMLHQYEEHDCDRFRLWVNNMIGHGRDVLTPIATFSINSLLVWLLDIVGDLPGLLCRSVARPDRLLSADAQCSRPFGPGGH